MQTRVHPVGLSQACGSALRPSTFPAPQPAPSLAALAGLLQQFRLRTSSSRDNASATAAAGVTPTVLAPRPGKAPRKAGSTGSSTSSSTKKNVPKEERLQSINGVGQKNEDLLLKKGIRTVSHLLQAFRKQHSADKALFEKYLQTEIGIRNRAHINSIVDHLSTLDLPKPKVTLSVEGNISAGKTTFLSILQRHHQEKEDFKFIPEPIEQWQNVSLPDNKGKVNLLELFYRDPKRMAYTFQNYVFLTRVMQERDSYYNTKVARLLERSVFSDRMVFVRAVHALQQLNDHELAIYDSWFRPILNTLPTLVPNGFIYLRASPDTCLSRLKKRNRSEETTIELSYLEELHMRHEDWLKEAAELAMGLKKVNSTQAPADLMAQFKQHVSQRSASGQQASMSSASASSSPPHPNILSLHDSPPLGLDKVEIPASLRDNLYFIDASKVQSLNNHGHLHQLPALVLECDEDVDVDRDLEHGRRVSQMVNDYVKFLQDYITERALRNADGSGVKSEYWHQDSVGDISYLSNPFVSNGLLLPQQQGGLWLPPSAQANMQPHLVGV